MELFESPSQITHKPMGPLAHRLRPRSLDEFVGQEHLLSEGQPLRLAIEPDAVSSCVFWGPPGCGKTTLAQIIAHRTSGRFEPLFASTTGIPELRKLMAQIEQRLQSQGEKTILFLDEIHRFNKAQQDFLLSFVENGTVILIGATTENPSFEINAPLLSRMQVYPFRPLEPDHIRRLVERALTDAERGLGKYKVALSDDAMQALILVADGDVRLALNALELAVQTCKPDAQHTRSINAEAIHKAVQKRLLRHDPSGDEHYNLISAFIKSMRGSDPDAAIYWLARMLEAGEDARFIARRMVILASEDIGNADPQALLIADAAAQAVEFVGLPEAQLNLAQATIYLACAPKSNASYLALLAAQKDVREQPAYPVPLHLRNAPTQLMRELGYGKGCQYAHDFPDHIADQGCLPDALQGKRYYQPTDIGMEARIREYLSKVKGKTEKGG
jgi:putative ATPase